jgi:hypothetical protein
MSSPVQDTLMDSSSVEAEVIAAVATIDVPVDNNQGASEDGKIPDLNQVRKHEARARLDVKHCEKESQTMASPCEELLWAKPLRDIIPLH